jgi:hypothetical protein
MLLDFGLRLSLRSGREALVRLVLTAAAVAVGAAVLLCVFADYNAFAAGNERPAWEQTAGTAAAGYQGPTTDAEVWYYSDDYYQGQTIERLDVGALGPDAPLPPGVAQLPAPGTYEVSPALAALLRSVPADQLGDRFPGTESGIIGDAALTGPTELAVYVGYRPAQLKPLRNAIVVTRIANGPQTSVWTNYFRYAYGVGAIAFTLPILILIGTATRLAAARREERFASVRLVGATNRQIGVLAAVDALLAALIGSVAGVGIFLAVRPALADYAVIGARYFDSTVTPKIWGYLAVLIGIPLLSALAAVMTLRRVRISPLGVSRRTRPPEPSVLRILPLLLGLALFAVGIAVTSKESIGTPTYPGLLVIVFGLVIAGPWLTAKSARLLARMRGTASATLAARRLTDNPKAAFRSVSGLILAVFLGTLLAGLMPVINSTTATPGAEALQNVLLTNFTEDCLGGCQGPTPNVPVKGITSAQVAAVAGLAPPASARLLEALGRFTGAELLPVYTDTDLFSSALTGRRLGAATGVVPCAGLAAFPALGDCPAGTREVLTDTSHLMSDNPYYSTQSMVNAATPTTSVDVSTLPLSYLLIEPTGPAQLEQIRTYLATHTTASASAAAPETFGEQVQTRLNVSNIVQRLFDIAVVLTLLVAGCSLAVAVGGGLVERKRPFALLRVSGAGVGTLYRVVLLESVLPLFTAAIVAGGTAYLLAYLTVAKMGPAGTPAPRLSAAYYATTGGGLLAAVLVVLTVLPILGRISGPEHARFE